MTLHQPLLDEIERLTKLGKEGYKIYIDELAEKEQKEGRDNKGYQSIEQ